MTDETPFVDDLNIVIVTRRIKVHEVVGGAVWKIAYADFVTAMMAFFMLLWILNASTQEQAVGIGDYFSPAAQTESVSQLTKDLEGLTFDQDNVMDSIKHAPSPSIDTPNFGGEERGDLEGKERTADDAKNFYQTSVSQPPPPALKRLAEEYYEILSHFTTAPQLQIHRQSVYVRYEPHGARLHIVAPQMDTIFKDKFSEELSDEGKKFIATIFSNLSRLPGKFILTGHTQNFPDKPFDLDEFSLSIQRAFNVQQWLFYLGLDKERIISIEGVGNSVPLRQPQQFSPERDNRISILVALDDKSQSGLLSEHSRILDESLLLENVNK